MSVQVQENETITKNSSLLNQNDRVVCVNPIQGIFKGRIYIVDEYIEPNIVLVSELDGTKVGAFNSSRFVLDHQEY